MKTRQNSQSQGNEHVGTHRPASLSVLPDSVVGRQKGSRGLAVQQPAIQIVHVHRRRRLRKKMREGRCEGGRRTASRTVASNEHERVQNTARVWSWDNVAVNELVQWHRAGPVPSLI